MAAMWAVKGYSLQHIILTTVFKLGSVAAFAFSKAMMALNFILKAVRAAMIFITSPVGILIAAIAYGIYKLGEYFGWWDKLKNLLNSTKWGQALMAFLDKVFEKLGQAWEWAKDLFGLNDEVSVVPKYAQPMPDMDIHPDIKMPELPELGASVAVNSVALPDLKGSLALDAVKMPDLSSSLAIDAVKVPELSTSLAIDAVKIPELSGSMAVAAVKVPELSTSLAFDVVKIPELSTSLAIDAVKVPELSSSMAINTVNIPELSASLGITDIDEPKIDYLSANKASVPGPTARESVTQMLKGTESSKTNYFGGFTFNIDQLMTPEQLESYAFRSGG